MATALASSSWKGCEPPRAGRVWGHAVRGSTAKSSSEGVDLACQDFLEPFVSAEAVGNEALSA
jgi:hypothetical protein